MKTLITRTLTGIIYVVLIVGGILVGKYAFMVLFSIILSYTLYEFYRLCKHNGNRPNIFIGIVTSLYLFVSFFLYDMKMVSEFIFLGLIPLLMLIPIIELFRSGERSMQNIAYTLLGIVYVAFPFSVLSFIASPYTANPNDYSPEILLGLFVLLWANDSGAYLVGSWLGKHKMIEKVSPKKTWEGAIGGALFAIVVAIIFFSIIDLFSIVDAIAISLLTIIAGTFGDLVESMMKRNFMVKDSGHILPGHGGMLDRFDSMLFAAPVYFIYVTLTIN